MSETDTIKGIRRTAERRAHADAMRLEATRELRNYCLLAQAEGVAISRIAEEAGLSRQGVYDLLRPSRPA